MLAKISLVVLMDDHEVDPYITERVSDLGLTLHDFIYGRLEMSEILTEGKYDPYKPYGNLAIPLKDVVRYWWNNFADHDAIIDMALCDLVTEYKDRFLPEKEPEKSPDTLHLMDELLEVV